MVRSDNCGLFLRALWFFLVCGAAFFSCGRAIAKDDPAIRCRETTCQILCYTRDKSGKTVRSQGTGIWSGRGRLILTNAHVIDSAEAIFIVDHNKKVVRGNVYRKSSMLDIAVIKATRDFDTPSVDMAFVPENRLKKGEFLLTMHYDLNMRPVFTRGSYRGRKKLGEFALLDVSMKLGFGSSGSGVFTRQGKLAGMVVGTRNPDGYQGYILPSSELSIILDELDYIFFRESMTKRSVPLFSLPGDELLKDEKAVLARALSMYRQQEYMKACDVLGKLKVNHPDMPGLAVLSAALLVRLDSGAMAINELLPWNNMAYSSYVFFYAAKIYDEVMNRSDDARKFYRLSIEHLVNREMRPLVEQRIRLLDQ